jgi:hypothetical protein
MPQLKSYLCDRCDYRPHTNFGDAMYVVDKDGTRIICPHPCEYKKVHEILGVNASEEEIEQNTGYLSDCVCVDCLATAQIDLKCDERLCHYCGSNQVVSFANLRGRMCPKCHKGTIQEHLHGIWT